MTHCPDPEELGAYLEGRLPEASLETFQAHLADCPHCRDHAFLTHRVALAPPRIVARSRRFWAGWAAAAAAFLLALAWWPEARQAGLPSQGQTPVVTERPTAPLALGGVLETRDAPRWWDLPGGGRLALAPASRLLLEEGNAASLAQGALWLEGESALAQVRTSLGTVQPRGAECLVRMRHPKPGAAAFLLPSALADEAPSLIVACFRGRLQVQGPGGPWDLAPGHLLEIAPGRPSRQRALDPKEPGGLLGWLEPLRAGQVYAGTQVLGTLRGDATPGQEGVVLEGKSARLDLPAWEAGDYSLEVTLKGRRPEGDLGLAFPAEGLFPYWVLPVQSLGHRASRLVIRRQGDLILLSQDGESLSTLSGGNARNLKRGSEAPGLAVWGASVEILEIRVTTWRSMP